MTNRNLISPIVWKKDLKNYIFQSLSTASSQNSIFRTINFVWCFVRFQLRLSLSNITEEKIKMMIRQTFQLESYSFCLVFSFNKFYFENSQLVSSKRNVNKDTQSSFSPGCGRVLNVFFHKYFRKCAVESSVWAKVKWYWFYIWKLRYKVSCCVVTSALDRS